jgi:hypothetical protein
MSLRPIWATQWDLKSINQLINKNKSQVCPSVYVLYDMYFQKEKQTCLLINKYVLFTSNVTNTYYSPPMSMPASEHHGPPFSTLHYWPLCGGVHVGTLFYNGDLGKANQRPSQGTCPYLLWREIQIVQSNVCMILADSFDNSVNEVTVRSKMDKLT